MTILEGTAIYADPSAGTTAPQLLYRGSVPGICWRGVTVPTRSGMLL